MRKLILLSLLLLIVCFPALADDDGYRLRQPDAEEYLQVAIEYLREHSGHFVLDQDSLGFPEISASILHLFKDDSSLSFEAIYDAYEQLYIGYMDGVYRGEWNSWLVQRWFDEHQPDLTTTDVLELAPEFVIQVTPRDFNVDGVDEYILDVYNVDTIHMYLVAVFENNSYRIIHPELPWSGFAAYGRYSEGEGQITEYDFRDINDDGLPEWMMLSYGITAGGPGMGYVDAGALYVFGWRDNAPQLLVYTYRDSRAGSVSYDELTTFEDVETIGDMLPVTVTFDFENIDADPALEILQSQPTTNNWGCRRVETRRFDWDANADKYLYQDTDIHHESNSRNCLQQSAEEAMWSADYASAIDLFERALRNSLPDVEQDYLRDRMITQDQYLRARLALAYLFTNEPDAARELLQQLTEEIFTDNAISAYVETLNDLQDGDLMRLCSAAFNVFVESTPRIVIGGTSDNPYYDGLEYDPAGIGCDAPMMIRERIQSAQISTETSPEHWLEENGIGISRILSADLNQDGEDEVLVWTDVPGVQILFVPDGENYVLTQPSVDPYQYADELDTWMLPEDARMGIVTLDIGMTRAYFSFPPWPTTYSPYGDMGGGPLPKCRSEDSDVMTSTNSIRIWTLDHTNLVDALRLDTCASSIEDALGDGGRERISTRFYDYDYRPDEGDVYIEILVNYVWDPSDGQYVQERIPTPPIYVTPTSTPSPTSTSQSTYIFAGRAFVAGAYDEVVQMTPETLDFGSTENIDRSLFDMYLRALSLQALGQYQQALELYVRLQDDAPDHIIGMLAALHFELAD